MIFTDLPRNLETLVIGEYNKLKIKNFIEIINNLKKLKKLRLYYYLPLPERIFNSFDYKK